MKQETNSTKKYYYCFTSITIDGNREITKLEMLSRFDSFFDFKGSDTKSCFFPSEMFDGERLCVKDTAANGVFIISTSSPIESWELFAFCKYNDKVSTGDGLIQSVRTPYCTDPTFFVQPIMAVEYDPVAYSCANVLARDAGVRRPVRDKLVEFITSKPTRSAYRNFFERSVPIVEKANFHLHENTVLFPPHAGRTSPSIVYEKIVEHIKEEQKSIEKRNAVILENITRSMRYSSDLDGYNTSNVTNYGNTVGAFRASSGVFIVQDNQYRDGGFFGLVTTDIDKAKGLESFDISLPGVYNAFVERYGREALGGRIPSIYLTDEMTENLDEVPILAIHDGKLTCLMETVRFKEQQTGLYRVPSTGLLDRIGTQIRQYFEKSQCDYDDVIIVHDNNGHHALFRGDGFVDAVTLTKYETLPEPSEENCPPSDVQEAINHFVMIAERDISRSDVTSGGRMEAVFNNVSYTWFYVNEVTAVITKCPKFNP